MVSKVALSIVVFYMLDILLCMLSFFIVFKESKQTYIHIYIYRIITHSCKQKIKKFQNKKSKGKKSLYSFFVSNLWFKYHSCLLCLVSFIFLYVLLIILKKKYTKIIEQKPNKIKYSVKSMLMVLHGIKNCLIYCCVLICFIFLFGMVFFLVFKKTKHIYTYRCIYIYIFIYGIITHSYKQKSKNSKTKIKQKKKDLA